MNTRRIIGIIGLIVFVISLVVLAVSFLPTQMKVEKQNISPSDMELPQRNSLPIFFVGVMELMHLLRSRNAKHKHIALSILMCGLVLSACAVPTQAPLTDIPKQTAPAAVTQRPTQAVAATQPPAPTPPSAATPTKDPSGGGGLAIVRPPESRVIELQYPSRVYLGDTPSITLSLVISPDGKYLTPTAKSPAGQIVTDPIKIDNLYDTHNVVVIATLESIGFKIDHPGNWEQPMLPGQDAKWIWTISPDSEGIKTFKILLQLRYVPKESGETINKPLWVRDFDLEVSKYLFLPLAAARTFGVIGFVGGGIGSIVGFPLAKEIATWIWEKVRGKPKEKKKKK